MMIDRLIRRFHIAIYIWIWNLDRMPRIVRWLYPKAHWCPEMDGLPITNNFDDCFCGVVKR